MPLLLLSARPSLRTNARLVEAGRNLGVEVHLKDAVPLVASIGEPQAGLYRESLPISEEAAGWSVLARVGNWRPESMLSLLEAACASGMKTLNPPSAIRRGRDHWLSLEAAFRAGIPIPRTLVGMDPDATALAAAEALEFPLVVKIRRSRMGVGVMQAGSRDQLQAILDSLWRLGEEFLLQEFIPTEGRSLRLLVLQGRVIAAARFEAAAGEWRSNGARGGKASGWDPPEDLCRIAVDAVESLGLGLAGIDLLEGTRGPVLCEINPTPGFVHLEEATGVDVASAIIRAAIES